MKINHECPLALLDLSKEWNDYEFCLPHLLDESPEYLDYFKKAKEKGRYIIMDNSLHELGKAYDHKRLIHWVNELKPDEFIVPDVWMDSAQTLAQAKYWMQVELPEEVTKVAVVQGATPGDALLCYKTLKDLGYEKVAFSYGADWYKDLGKDFSISQAVTFDLINQNPHVETIANSEFREDIKDSDFIMLYSLGRISFIKMLYDLKIIKSYDRIHLLGAYHYIEFMGYKNFELDHLIETIDTSNPVMRGLDEETYNVDNDMKMESKPTSNINNSFYLPVSSSQTGMVLYNTQKFKELLTQLNK